MADTFFLKESTRGLVCTILGVQSSFIHNCTEPAEDDDDSNQSGDGKIGESSDSKMEAEVVPDSVLAPELQVRV